MQKLQMLIDMLTQGRALHISVLDVSGILHSSLNEVRFENVIHSKQFCNIAKSTHKGSARCLRCKALANTKAILGKEAFAGHCFWGIYEAAYPVVINGSVAAVVYVGNAIVDRAKSESLIENSCRRIGVDPVSLYLELDNCEYLDDPNEAAAIAEIVGDYIRIVCAKAPQTVTKEHWLVTSLKRHAENSQTEETSLHELAVTYHKNEKYIGRLFKRAVGVSFHEYCNQIRLQKAAELLKGTQSKVLDVALECGFDNVSYFNRLFKKTYGISPSDYRKRG